MGSMKIIVLSIFIAIGFTVIFSNLSNPLIQRWDESTNIKVVKSLNQDFLAPEVDGHIFFEKPPLWYWSTFSITKVLGNSISSYRLISAISFAIIFLLVIYIGYKNFGFIYSLFGSLIFIFTLQLITPDYSFIFSTHNFKSADLDTLMIMFSFISFFLFNEYLKKDQNKFFYLGVGFSGLAFMTKGPMAIVPIISFLIYCKFIKRKINWKLLIKAFVLILLIVLPWHIYEWIKYGNAFINTYFLYHNIDRYAEPLENHSENIFFYFRILIDPRLFPGFIFFGLSLLQLRYWKNFLQNKIAAQAFLNIALGLVVITLVQTKLSWYILFIYPFIAVFCSAGLFTFIKSRHEKGAE